MTNKEIKLSLIRESIGTTTNFPKEGIIFRDIFGIYKNPTALKALKEVLLEDVALLDFDVVVGLDSRGFLIGPLISLELSKPFVPVRKKGKLPGKTIQQAYELEYGRDTLEIQLDSVVGKKKALIVDDLLASGGTLSAAESLLRSAGVITITCLVIVELTPLNGRSKITAPVHSLIKYN